MRSIFGEGEGLTGWTYPLPEARSALRPSLKGRVDSSRRLALQQPRQFPNITPGMAHEEAAQGADAVDHAQSEIARGAPRRDVVGEQTVERVSRGGEREGIEAPPAFVARQRLGVADVEA